MEDSKERGIVIVGAGHVGKTALDVHELAKGLEVIHVEQEKPRNPWIVIDGETYEQIVKEQPKTPKMLPSIMALAAMYAPYMDYGSPRYFRKLPDGINIIEEYKLIRQKKSKLSKWERDAVEIVFNRNFTKVNG